MGMAFYFPKCTLALELHRESVTARMATPGEVDSKLTETWLESCRRATKALEGLRDAMKA